MSRAKERQPVLIAADQFVDDEQEISVNTSPAPWHHEEVVELLAQIAADEDNDFIIKSESGTTLYRSSSAVGDMIFRAHSLAEELQSRNVPAFVWHTATGRRHHQK